MLKPHEQQINNVECSKEMQFYQFLLKHISFVADMPLIIRVLRILATKSFQPQLVSYEACIRLESAVASFLDSLFKFTEGVHPF